MQQKSKISRVVSKILPFTQKDEKKTNNTQKSVYCQAPSTSTAEGTPITPDNQKTKSSYGQPGLPRPTLAPQPEKNFMLKKLAIEMCRFGVNQSKESFVSTPFGLAWLLCVLYESTDAQSKTEILALLEPKGRIKKDNLLKLVPAMLDRLKAEKAYRNDFLVTLESFLQTVAAVRIRSEFEKNVGTKYIMKVKPTGSGRLLSATVKGIFKDFWEKPFDPKLTVADDFFGLNGTRKENFMHREGAHLLPYFEDYTMQAVRLDAKSTEMWIVLPKAKVTLEDYVKTFDEAALDKLVDRENTQLIQISLPKFETKHPISTIGFLLSRGVKTIFAPGKNRIPGMVDVNLWLEEIKEQIEVKIDEAGCDAKLETPPMGNWAAPPPIQFRADRPFLYFLCMDKEPLFAGVFM